MSTPELPPELQQHLAELVEDGFATPAQTSEALALMDRLSTAELLGVITPEAAHRQLVEHALRVRKTRRR